MTDSETQRNQFGQPVGFPVPGWTARPMPPRTAMTGRFAMVEALDPDRHAAALFEANADDREGRNWTYYNYGPFPTLADYRKWVESSSADAARLFHAIIDQASGAVRLRLHPDRRRPGRSRRTEADDALPGGMRLRPFLLGPALFEHRLRGPQIAAGRFERIARLVEAAAFEQ
jgi:hypothetical protein